MKKKLLSSLLAFAMTASMATIMIGCDKDNGDDNHTHTFATEWTADNTHHWKSATCEHTAEVIEKAEHSWGTDGKCTGCQKEKPIVTTVTQEEWTAFFDSLNTISFELEMSASEVGVSHSFKQHNDVYYWEQAINGESEISYTHYDAATYTVTMYWRNWTDVDIDELEGEWEKLLKVPSNNPEEYLSFKEKYWGLGCTMFENGFALQENGETVGLSELYSAFTYDSDSDTYTSNLFWSGNTEMVVTLKFENGKIVSGSMIQTVSEQLVTMNFTFGYDITELVIPTEILNAAKNS